VRWAAGGGRIGAVYDWREAASSVAEDRSEITGFYSVAAGERSQLLFYGIKGVGEGSPDWGAGLSLSMGF
jgi:hypothetical protein